MMRWRMSFPGRPYTISPAAVELHSTMSLWSDQPIVLAISPTPPASDNTSRSLAH